MGTLYIDRKDLHVKLDGNALAFYVNDEREGIVPINPLKRVVIVGNVTIDTPVLHRLSDENISVIFLSGRRMKFRGMMHGRLHNNGLLRVKQYEKSLSLFSIEFSKEIVEGKISSQLNLLKTSVEKRPDLRLSLISAINTLNKIQTSLSEFNFQPSTLSFEPPEGLLETLRGLEGSATAAYFSGYTTLFPESLNFKNRNRRPPKDPVNAMLSLCYTMLHYELVREIEVTGLDPIIGFYHQFEYGRESLACDLVELFRSDVDQFVWTLFRERVCTERDFINEDERAGCYLKKGSRKRFYPLYEEWAKAMRPQFTECVRALAKRILNGEIEDTFE
jgi:CRISPR-associated protein Cas1